MLISFVTKTRTSKVSNFLLPEETEMLILFLSCLCMWCWAVCVCVCLDATGADISCLPQSLSTKNTESRSLHLKPVFTNLVTVTSYLTCGYPVSASRDCDYRWASMLPTLYIGAEMQGSMLSFISSILPTEPSPSPLLFINSEKCEMLPCSVIASHQPFCSHI